jgi:hypothetical protein
MKLAMSFTIELRGKTSMTWVLSKVCVGQIERLRRTEARALVDTIFGDAETAAGTARAVDGAVLRDAIRGLRPVAKKLPNGFEVRMPDFFRRVMPGIKPAAPLGTRGAGGVLIGGKYHLIMCHDDYWTIQAADDVGGGKDPVRHYEPAEIQSDNMGRVEIHSKKRSPSQLAQVLQGMQDFLEHDRSKEVTVIWG